MSDKDKEGVREGLSGHTSLYLSYRVLILSFLCFLFLQMEAYIVVSGGWQDHPVTVAISVPCLVGDYRAEVRAAHLDNRVLFGAVQGETT